MVIIIEIICLGGHIQMTKNEKLIKIKAKNILFKAIHFSFFFFKSSGCTINWEGGTNATVKLYLKTSSEPV